MEITNQKKAEVAILILDILQRKENYQGQREVILIKRSIHQEDIKILNVYAPKNKASKYMKQKLAGLKGEIDKSKIVVCECNTFSNWQKPLDGKSARIQMNWTVSSTNNKSNQCLLGH